MIKFKNCLAKLVTLRVKFNSIYQNSKIFNNYFQNKFLMSHSKLISILVALICSVNISIAQTHTKKVSEAGTRDPLLWPFKTTSIWNMPIGSNAQYVPADLEFPKERLMTVDEDYIVLTPEAPLMDIYKNNAFWDRTKDRCVKTGELIGRYPIPQSFVVSPETWDGKTPNAGIAILMPDKRTIIQGQPFAHCEQGNYATLGHLSGKPEDIYGEGYSGAHGGSQLSAIGGCIRNHELTPTSGPIRHAIKINVAGRWNIFYDEVNRGYRWPATAADSDGNKYYGKYRTKAPQKEMRMGALLAIPATVNLDTFKLETKPAKILAQALQDYGGYVVDGTGWSVYAIITEWGPSGRFTDNFKKNWGFDFTTTSNKLDSPWARDMAKIFAALNIVVNNAPNSIGGGGKPRVALAPPFRNK